MRKLVLTSFMSLDGVSDDPVGWDDTDAGGWSLPFFDEELNADAHGEVLASDLFVCGRVTYEGFAKFGPAMKGEYAEALNAMPKLVGSTTLNEPLEWNASLIEGDVTDRIRELKLEPGRQILTYGGANLVQTLIRDDLLDECKIGVCPLILGRGKRLFPDGVEKSDWELIDTKNLSSGLIYLTYRRVGERSG